MTEAEWRKFPKESGVPVWFLRSDGKPIKGAAVGFIARGATVLVKVRTKDGSEVRRETYQTYQCLYAEKPEKRPEEKTAKEKPVRVCPACGKKFTPNPGRKYQKYCSRQCSWEACVKEWRRRADEKKAERRRAEQEVEAC